MGYRVTPGAEQIPVNVVGSSTFGRYPKVSLEKTYNMFESDGWLVDFPGYQKVLQLLAAGIEGRGIFRSFRGNIYIAVVDGNVYRVTANSGVLLVGTLQTFSGEVFIDENLNYQICIVDGLHAYIYNYQIPGPNLAVQNAGALGTGALIPNYVTYHNTFFLFGNRNNTASGAAWYAYLPDTQTTIKQHDQLFLQTKPDYPLAVKRIPGQSANVLVLGGSVAEIHTQTSGISTSGTAITYVRNQSFSSDYGCLSVSTIAESDTHIIWLGVNEKNAPAIMMFTGNAVKHISTDGIDYLLDSLKHPEMSTAIMYRIDGHLFYHLTFFYINQEDPQNSDNITLLYDVDNEKFYHGSDQNLNYHPARQAIYFNQQLLFISINGGGIYHLSTDITSIIEDTPSDEFDLDPNLIFEMQRIRICKSIRFPTSGPFKANQFVMTIEQGVSNIAAVQDCIILMITEDNIRMFSEFGGSTGSGLQLVPEHAGQEDCVATPYRARIDLAISKDGAEVFSNYVSRYLNPLGVHKNILNWNKLGGQNDLTLKLRFWSLGRFVVNNGIVDVTT